MTFNEDDKVEVLALKEIPFPVFDVSTTLLV